MLADIMGWVHASKDQLSTSAFRVVSVQPEGEDRLLDNLLLDHIIGRQVRLLPQQFVAIQAPSLSVT